jgi:hypothetical protein
VAAELIVSNRSFIQEETMAWIDAQPLSFWGSAGPMTRDQRGKCKRDVGYIVDALANDLMIGGADMTIDYTQYYLGGAILPDGQIQPTIQSMNYVADLCIQVATKANVANAQSAVAQSFVGTTFNVTIPDKVFRTTAITKYSFYRMELLQNTDNAAFIIPQITFHEFDVPKTLCDGPALGDSIVEKIEVVNGGTGYVTGSTSVSIEHIAAPEPGKGIDDVFQQAKASVTIDANGAVESIDLDPRSTDQVESVGITEPGLGYLRTPTVTFSGSATGENATGKAFINKDGAVTEILVISKGKGYDDSANAPIIEIEKSSESDPEPVIEALAEASTTRPGLVMGGKGYYTGSDAASGLGANVIITGSGTGAQAIAVMKDDYCEIECPVFKDIATLNIDVEGRIEQVNITEHGAGYLVEEGADGVTAEPLLIPPTISIPPPLDKQPFITGSPYCQNSSNISGPFTKNGIKIPATLPLPYKVNDVFDDGQTPEVLDAYGAGGGCRIDGNCCAPASPLRSMVLDAFTQVSQGSISFLETNFAYAQYVSVFATFSAIHLLTLEGSFANMSNSVTDFGLRGLVSRGKTRTPYLSGKAWVPYNEKIGVQATYDFVKQLASDQFVIGKGYRSFVESVDITDAGAGYTGTPTVTIAEPQEIDETGAQQAAAVVNPSGIVDGELQEITIIEEPEDDEPNTVGYRGGMGYRFPPTVTLEDGTLVTPATAEARLSGVNQFRVYIDDPSQRPANTKPDVTSLARIHGKYYVVSLVGRVVEFDPETEIEEEKKDPEGNEGRFWDITLAGGGELPPYIDLETDIEFYQVSYISTGSHVFEYSGSYDQSGCSYNSLPQYGGISH